MRYADLPTGANDANLLSSHCTLIVFITRHKNIDTESITDTIQNIKLINSGKFVCRYEICQCDGAATCLPKAKRHGQSSDCSAYWWRISVLNICSMAIYLSIVKNAGGKSDVYYKFTFKLQNLQTGIVEWTGEKEIRKAAKRLNFWSLI